VAVDQWLCLSRVWREACEQQAKAIRTGVRAANVEGYRNAKALAVVLREMLYVCTWRRTEPTLAGMSEGVWVRTRRK
jgi:hypothetical protein